MRIRRNRQATILSCGSGSWVAHDKDADKKNGKYLECGFHAPSFSSSSGLCNLTFEAGVVSAKSSASDFRWYQKGSTFGQYQNWHAAQ